MSAHPPWTPTIVVLALLFAGILFIYSGVSSPSILKIMGLEINSSSVGLVMVALAVLLLIILIQTGKKDGPLILRKRWPPKSQQAEESSLTMEFAQAKRHSTPALHVFLTFYAIWQKTARIWCGVFLYRKLARAILLRWAKPMFSCFNASRISLQRKMMWTCRVWLLCAGHSPMRFQSWLID